MPWASGLARLSCQASQDSKSLTTKDGNSYRRGLIIVHTKGKIPLGVTPLVRYPHDCVRMFTWTCLMARCSGPGKRTRSARAGREVLRHCIRVHQDEQDVLPGVHRHQSMASQGRNSTYKMTHVCSDLKIHPQGDFSARAQALPGGFLPSSSKVDTENSNTLVVPRQVSASGVEACKILQGRWKCPDSRSSRLPVRKM